MSYSGSLYMMQEYYSAAFDSWSVFPVWFLLSLLALPGAKTGFAFSFHCLFVSSTIDKSGRQYSHDLSMAILIAATYTKR